eukprot:1141491-Pelagomonas_calceolata.AAC.1
MSPSTSWSHRSWPKGRGGEGAEVSKHSKNRVNILCVGPGPCALSRMSFTTSWFPEDSASLRRGGRGGT